MTAADKLSPVELAPKLSARIAARADRPRRSESAPSAEQLLNQRAVSSVFDEGAKMCRKGLGSEISRA